MWPYVLAATLIVVLVGGVWAWRAGLLRPQVQVADVRVRGTPSHGRGGGAEGPRPEATFTARGTWVLSALPDCLRQRWERRGPAALTAVPAGAQRLGRGAVVRAGACRLNVRSDDVVVTRGGDRYGVPAPARLYVYAGGVLLAHDDRGRRELRAYRFVR